MSVSLNKGSMAPVSVSFHEDGVAPVSFCLN